MALSGSIYTNVSSHWRLTLSWSATQNIAANQSTVTADLYWQALDSYGAVNSSATKTALVSVNHNDYQTSAAGMAGLSANQKKLIVSHSYTIDHNSDGTASFTLDGWFQAQVTLNGTYYDTINLTQTTFDLDTIPRASSLTSSANWTAGNDFTLSISRASSSFTHTADIYVNGVLIHSVTGIGTSASSGFSTANNTTIFQQLAQGSSQDTKIVLTTYSGSTNIGNKTYTGTVTAPASSTLSSYPSSFNIGDALSFGIARANSTFLHTISLTFGSPVYTASATNVGTGGGLTYSSSSMYSKIPTTNSGTGTFTITTYYNGVQVQGTHSYSFTAKVTGSNPTFSSSNISYADTNTTITALTGNSAYIVQNKSTLTAYVNTAATMLNSATFKQYTITCNGVTKTLTSTTGNVSLGAVTAGSNVTLSIQAIDSRGNSTTVTKTVTIVPYSDPTISAKALRTDNFETETTLSLSGTFSTVSIGGTNKNAIKTATYAYKASTASTYGTASNFTITPNGSAYSAANVVLETQLDNLQSWNVLVTVTDTFGASVPYTINVSTGQPLVFFDDVLQSTGINQFPIHSHSLEVTGQVYLNADPTVADSAPLASVFGSDVTQKVYLNFGYDSSSNDPAFIMHETSNVAASVNRGVLHLCPTDDNDNVNDYVTIHGTNDPETIKLYTGGNIVTTGDLTASKFNGVAMELRASGGTPYIDFSNDSTIDFDARLILIADDTLQVSGANLDLGNNNLNAVNAIYGKSGTIAESYDEWLRFNNDGSHSSGIYFGSSVVRTDGILEVGSSGANAYFSSGTASIWGRAIASTHGSSTIFQAGVVAVPANVTSSNQTFHIGVSSFGTIDGIVCSIQDNYGVSFAMTAECHPYGSSPNNTIEFEINSNGGGNYSGVHISYIVFGH